METIRMYARVTGQVQCVGFRYFTCKTASRLGVTGWVRNCEDGSVELEVQGNQDSVQALLDAVAVGPRYAQVDGVEQRAIAPVDRERSFEARDAWM